MWHLTGSNFRTWFHVLNPLAALFFVLATPAEAREMFNCEVKVEQLLAEPEELGIPNGGIKGRQFSIDKISGVVSGAVVVFDQLNWERQKLASDLGTFSTRGFAKSGQPTWDIFVTKTTVSGPGWRDSTMFVAIARPELGFITGPCS
jgi:hypothetical protein